MRPLRSIATVLFALTLTGCLVSETPVLDAKTGKARPLDGGAHVICGIDENDELKDCEPFLITAGDDGAYLFSKEGESPFSMRFRRIARKAYAAQSAEDDGYMYYYASGDRRKLLMRLMNCPDLSENLRTKLIERDYLGAEDNDYSICTVKTVRGLVDAAKAYHRGSAAGEEELRFAIIRSPDQGAAVKE